MSHGGQQRLALLSRASIGALVALFVIVPVLIGQAASPPNIVSYQGRLLDANSSPVSASTADMVFELYDADVGGNCVWSNSSSTCASSAEITVTLTDGLFSENLGDTGASPAYAAIGDDIFADNASLYLQVTVEGEPLTPRKQITAAPYALNSETLDGYNSSLTGGTSSFVPVTDSNGNLILTGDPTGSTVSTGVVYVNPTTAAATETILGLAVNGTQAFRVTGDGDIETTGSLTFSDQSETIIFANAENINNTSDGQIVFTGSGGSTDTDLAFVLDGAFPTILSNLGSGVGFVGNILFGADNSFSIGTSGANRPSTINLGTSAVVAGTTTLASNSLDSTGTFSFNTTNNAAINTGTGLVTTGGGLTVTGALNANGNTLIGDDASDTIQLSGSIQGSTPFRFEGTTVDGFDTLFAITDPTLTDKTITFPNATGEVSLLGQTISNAELDNSSVSYGGVSVSLGASDATPAFDLTDATSLPIVAGTSGTLSVARGGTGATTFTTDGVLYGNGTGALQATSAGTSGQLLIASAAGSPGFVSLSGDGTLAATGALTITQDSVALTTDTTGNYVASVTNGSGITGGDGGSEGAALTLALGNLSSNWSQGGAFDIVLDNASSELRILESTGGAFYGTFDVTDLSADRTYTFQDATGTVAFLSDLTGSTVTLDTAYDGGGSGLGRTITADSGAIAIQNSTVGGAQLFDIAHSASGALTANSDITTGVSSARTLTAAQTITDDFETFKVERSTTVNNAGGDFTSRGAVAFFSNTLTQTAGTLSDSTHVIEIEQDASSTGAALRVASGSTFLADDLVVGGLALSETLSNPGFSLSGDDLFVADSAGIEGNIYTDGALVVGNTTTVADGAISQSTTGAGTLTISTNGGTSGNLTLDSGGSGVLNLNTTNNNAVNAGTGLFTVGGNLTFSGNSSIIDMTGTGTLGLNTTTNRDISTGTGGFDIGGHAAIGGGASVGTLEILNLSEDIACTSTCATVRAAVTNTTTSFTDQVIGGNFNALSAVASAANGVLNGLKGSAQTTGSVTFSGDIIGTLGTVEVSSGNPTYTNAQGVTGKITLNDLTDITGAATGVASQLALTTNQTLTGAGRLFTGSFAPSDGTIASVDGLNLSIGGTGGTITDLTGIYVSLDPSSGTEFSSSNTVQGINLEIDGDNANVLTTDASVYGINVSATTATDVGTPDTYGVRASASGGTNNYSGYFYGGPFIVAGDATAPAISSLEVSGAGDLHVENVLEVIGDMWVKGGSAAFETASGSTDVYIQSGLTTGYTGTTLKVDSTGAEWTIYGAGSSATITNGSATDLRWNAGTASDRGGDDEMRLTASGDLFLDGDITTLNGTVSSGADAADLAEVYVVDEPNMEPGDLLGLTSDGDIVLARSEYRLFGVVSTKPGFLLDSVGGEIPGGSQPVGLSGRVPTKVNLEGGTIAAGDPITVSSVAGVGMKATGPGMIVGFALESYTGIESPIDVFVNLQWNPGGKITMDGSAVAIESDLVVNALADATPTTSAVDSESLVLRGSAFDVAATPRDISFKNIVTNATDYRLSIRNAVDTEIAYVDQDGAFSVAGDVIVGDHLYPSDRGTPQTNRYIFYDGSSGPGGDFMRTNAAGWATGSYDFAEMFPSAQKLKPGDVVTFASASESVERSSESYSGRIAGVVSTRPGFLAGENLPDNYPIALAGRVPTNVSNEGGEISVGDPLTTSSTTGVAMKATEAGMILGYALEDFSGSNGSVIAFINATYWNGQGAAAQPSNNASGLGASLGSLDLSGNVYIGANDILNVGSISGMNMQWEIAENGDFRTRGLVATTIEAYNGDLIDTYATTSPEVYVTLAGQAEMNDGRATVNLVKENPDFLATVSNMVPLRIVATPSAPIAVYVTNREDGKFDIMQLGGSSDGVMIDWYAVGVRKDFEQEEDLVIEEPGIPEEPDVEESDLTPEPPEEEEEEVEVAAEPTQTPVLESEPDVEEPTEVVDEVIEEASQGETESVVEEEVVEENPEPISEEEVVEEPVVDSAPEPEEEEVVEETPVVEIEPAPEPEPAEGSPEETEGSPSVSNQTDSVVPEEPASDVSSSPEPQQIPVESSNEDAGTASEGTTE